MDPPSRKKQGLYLPLKVDRECYYSVDSAQPAATKKKLWVALQMVWAETSLTDWVLWWIYLSWVLIGQLC
jgi:hypothetical protein